MATKAKKFYAVAKGRRTGIFNNWPECEASVKGVSNRYKSFLTLEEAQSWYETEAEHLMKPAVVSSADPDPAISNAKAIPVYVDGAYREGVASYGIFIDIPGSPLTAYGQAHNSDGNNVAGEIFGAAYAVKWAEAIEQPIILCYDYIGIKEWATGNWKRNKHNTEAYHRFMQPRLKWIAEFRHTPGHSGIPGNEMADTLAKKGLSGESKKLQPRGI